jgi:hypothetical protein
VRVRVGVRVSVRVRVRVRKSADGEVNDLPVLRQAAILTLARSLDQMGSALQMLSRQLTEMATPEVATRATMTITDQH